MSVSDNELISKARNHAVEALVLCISIKESPGLQRLLLRDFQHVLASVEEHIQLTHSPVTPEMLAEDLVDACYLEGWDTSLTFWDAYSGDENPRYDDDGNEMPSKQAARICKRLLERYEMKPRT